MLKRIKLEKGQADFVLRTVGSDRVQVERSPPSPGERLLYARVKDLGVAKSADLLLTEQKGGVDNCS